jgi:hypothetical protein
LHRIGLEPWSGSFRSYPQLLKISANNNTERENTMFKLILQDRKGNALNMGDIVKVSDGRYFKFYAEVKYLDKEKCITPFHTFSFHSFEKVDSVPENAIQSTEERYKIWYVPDEYAQADDEPDTGEKYLMDWRTCEHLLEQSCYRIELS